MMEKWHRIDAATGRPVEVVMGARREGKTAKMCQDAYKAGLLRAAEMAEEEARERYKIGEPEKAVAMALFADSLRQEAGKDEG